MPLLVDSTPLYLASGKRKQVTPGSRRRRHPATSALVAVRTLGITASTNGEKFGAQRQTMVAIIVSSSTVYREASSVASPRHRCQMAFPWPQVAEKSS